MCPRSDEVNDSDIDLQQVGRPLISVDLYEVEYLRSLRFSWTDIAALLGISRSTLYRRIESFGLLNLRYTAVTDSELDLMVCQIKSQSPCAGEVMVAAHLNSRNVHVPRSRLRAAIHRLDPDVHTNMRSAIRRRVYYVEAPNSCWHLDGCHKLVRWRLVIHGGIDGFSRVVVFLKCSPNNEAITMFQSFRRGVEEYGLPYKVRTDLGGENVDVWRYMIEQHGSNTRHVIVGSSTHNERIERLWRDVHRCVLKPFADKFRDLEENELLDPLNETDLYCLHYIFLPRIEKCVHLFQEAWNNHQLSTEANATPLQLFTAGLIAAERAPDAPQLVGLHNVVLPSSTGHVQVPRSKFTPCVTLSHQINSQYVPLSCDNYFDEGMFIALLSFVGQHLVNNCQLCLFS